MRHILCAAVVTCLAWGGAARAAEPPAASPTVLKVTFDRSGVPVPHWELRLDGDGQGTFKIWPSDAPPLSRTVHLSSPTWERMQRLLVASNHLTPCETKSRGLARIGVKQVEWRVTDAVVARCSFNYSDNKALTELSEMWNGMAATLDEGRRIAQLHRYDRLGLDKELTQYEHSVQQGFAAEPGLIQPELQALVEDGSLMERVRARAQRLLELQRSGRGN